MSSGAFRFGIYCTLLVINDHPNLIELTVRVYMRSGDDTEAFINSTHLMVKKRMAKAFVPQNVNFMNAGLDYQYCSLVCEVLRV